jgi:predicted oxidoreductase
MTNVPKVQMSPGGPQFSRLVQGYWRMAQWGMNTQQHLAFIKKHVELGISTVDHAPVYGDPSCESLFGHALKLDPSLREKIEIISKCGIYPKQSSSGNQVGHYDCRKDSILSSVDGSLKRLGVEHLDVLLIHRPDYLMDADEVAEAFTALKQSGKVRYFGVSNFTTSQFSLLQSRLDSSLITNQVELNPVNLAGLDNGTLEQLQQLEVRPMAWSCLAGGKIFSEQSERATRLRKTLIELANELGATSIDQVIYAWVMRMPAKPVTILGSGNSSRLASAVEALDLSLSQEQWYRVWVASKGHAVP